MQHDAASDWFDMPRPAMPPGKGYPLAGEGVTVVRAPPEAIWAIIMDETRLASAIPGADTLHRIDEHTYAADVSIGVGPLKTIYRVEVALLDLQPPFALRLEGGARGRFGHSHGVGHVRLSAVPDGTRIDYVYAVLISGRVAQLGGRLMDAAAGRLIDRFFALLAANASAEPA